MYKSPFYCLFTHMLLNPNTLLLDGRVKFIRQRNFMFLYLSYKFLIIKLHLDEISDVGI
ncbi:hypothetical protein SAMN05421731_103179 [Acinetobacter puyangensis]|uniref:Uncharacterized protein n=1 Tax=Acinetobacter puyangensis TaxID=1096779 RepID=A0A240E7E9_9GAMM|nr:hypothetical protein SAMN05421731_103179 [Acinetobacter puyangensis]